MSVKKSHLIFKCLTPLTTAVHIRPMDRYHFRYRIDSGSKSKYSEIAQNIGV